MTPRRVPGTSGLEVNAAFQVTLDEARSLHAALDASTERLGRRKEELHS